MVYHFKLSCHSGICLREVFALFPRYIDVKLMAVCVHFYYFPSENQRVPVSGTYVS